MTQKKIPAWAFLLPAAVFGVVAFLPVVRGGRLNLSLLVLAIVCAILGANLVRRNRRTDSQPPAA